MRYTLMLLVMTFCLSIKGQDISLNYIRTTLYMDRNATESNSIKTMEYFDGIGKLRQKVQLGYGGNGEDVVTQTDYDRRGNVSVVWQPIPSAGSNGAYIDGDAVRSASGFYGEGEIPYTKYDYEYHGINRLCSTAEPGKLWQGHDIQYRYTSNDTAGLHSCLLIMVNSDGSLVTKGRYPKGTLEVSYITNSDGIQTVSFKDRNGRTVMSRTISPDGSRIADTRRVYDSRGDLRYVISPEGMMLIPDKGSVSQDILLKFAYGYTYDCFHRVIEKRLPGCEPEYYVYDKLNRLLMEQDGVQRVSDRWTVTKYDIKGRTVLKGTATIHASRTALQNLYQDSLLTEKFIYDVNSAEFKLFYTSESGPVSFTPYYAWYYDNYEFSKDYRIEQNQEFDTDPSLPATGLCTGTAQVVNGNVWFTEVRYDHNKSPIMQSMYDIYLQDSRVTTWFKYNFSGNLIKRYEKVEDMTEQQVMGVWCAEWNYRLDAAERIKEITLSVNGSTPTKIEENNYDGIGRLSKKTAGVSTEYGYNVRSDLTSLVSPHFSQQMYYAMNPFDASKVNYSYICASTENIRDEELMMGNANTYSYNFMGHLVQASNSDGSMSETFETDLNSNVVGLERKFNGEKIQDAVMELDGNKTIGVHDVSTPLHGDAVASFPAGDYERRYDAKGRIVYDETRNITKISYNPILNLPQNITLSNGDYIYSEYMNDGTLLNRNFSSRLVSIVTKVDATTGDTIKRPTVRNVSESHAYRGSFERIGAKWRLHTGNGYYDLGTQQCYYYEKDRQGSTVAVVDGDGHTQQLTAYYPTGIPYSAFGYRRVTDRLHIGNKWMEHSGVYTYDNTARYHYPLIPSFDTPDPLAEQYYSISPYAHCAGNPIRFIDPSGMDVWEIDQNGIIANRIKDKTQDAFFMVSKDADGNYQRTFTVDEEGNKQYDSVSFDYGTIKSQETVKINGTDSYDVYTVKGDSNGKRLFEFMADNVSGSSSQVEFSLAETGVSGAKATDYVTTGHERGAEPGMAHLYLNKQSYTIRKIAHSHPVSNHRSADDLIQKNIYNDARRQNKQNQIKFSIYYVPDKKYIDY